jgi:cupin fold WbuC family metalloprotein
MRKRLGPSGQIEAYHAEDGRLIGLYVPGDFTDYVSFPPFVETAEERAHLAQAYKVTSPQRERETKAHHTEDALPLQLVLLNRDAGAYVRPHYHRNDAPATTATRHQILICQRGRLRVGLYTQSGERLGRVTLGPGDLVLMCEGHSLEFLDPETKVIEIKMGPFPGSDAADKVDLDVDREPVRDETRASR